MYEDLEYKEVLLEIKELISNQNFINYNKKVNTEFRSNLILHEKLIPQRYNL